MEIVGECEYRGEAVLVTPSSATPRRSLYLSNLDDQRFLRFSIKYLYVFPPSAAVAADALRAALARALVHYYPLAGRLRHHADDKLVLDCNAEGALFAEAFLPTLTAADFLRAGATAKPHKSWRKLLYRVHAATFVAVPPLVVQVTQLGCGGMVVCTAISHCVCDGIATANFLHAWAAFAAADLDLAADRDDDLSVVLHDRRALRPRCPPRVAFTHPEYHTSSSSSSLLLIQPQLMPLAPVSLTFTAAHLRRLKARSLRSCTSFEALAAHEAKDCIDDDYVRSTVDLLDQRRGAKPDLAATLVISAWTRLGLEDVDFGKGRAAHMGPLTSEIYCVFLPVLADPNAVTVLLSLPQPAADTFEHHCCSCFLLDLDDDQPAVPVLVDKQDHDNQLVRAHHQHDILA
ncbi:hypothetical protein OsJ_00040 [Oryza sativa Japonica Group]|uniref:Uncharacterized protein n=1 Tax=Oryza sativa subsp. japonica TaxID=39947 RepID=B9EYS3_ORYSJ|nr:hypothetical protein OsJ_00040 [Oryza sativa Japonica Group]